MEQRSDVLILGAGVIGLTTAYFLAKEGLRVHLLDKGEFGKESSWAGAGIVPPGNTSPHAPPLEKLRGMSTQQFPEFSQELLEKSGIDNGFRICGGLEFPTHDSDEHTEEWHCEGVQADRIRGEQILKIEPAVNPQLQEAVHIPALAQLRNPRHIQALTKACQNTGLVRFSPHLPVLRLVKNQSKIQGVETTEGIFSSPSVVITSGAWTPSLLLPLGISVGIFPVRGQIVLLRLEKPLVKHVLIQGSQYLVPRTDGRLLIGSTEEHVGFDRRTTVAGIQELLNLAIRLVPALQQAPIEKCWAGLRPGTHDGLPWIGPVPGIDNLYVAAGHFRAGFQLSIGTGILVREMILKKSSSVPLEPFRIDRK